MIFPAGDLTFPLNRYILIREVNFMKQHLLCAGKIFLDRLLFNFVSLLLLPFCIAMIDSMRGGPVLFSATICMLYLGIVYDTLWKMGKHDRQSYATEKHYALKGLAVGLISEIPFLVVLLFLGSPRFQRTFCLLPRALRWHVHGLCARNAFYHRVRPRASDCSPRLCPRLQHRL